MADQETAQLICQMAGHSFPDLVFSNEFDKIPCQDLLEIDRLWALYSQERFGFSVQAQIWLETGNNYSDSHWDGYPTVKAFLEAVGWRDDQAEIFSPLNKGAESLVDKLPSGLFPAIDKWPNLYGMALMTDEEEPADIRACIYRRLSNCKATIR
jgi:hypothetical protein